CGICGFTGFSDAGLLGSMVDALRHRGPDDRGTWSDGRVSLGHARLSIIDLSPRGRQPLSNEEGSIWITCNGEVYNYRGLREDLSRHTFSSATDTEVMVHAYEEYGMSFLDRLRGMYAFALWDGRERRLLLARDPLGKKPLYYYREGTTLLFASEMKAILSAFPSLGIGKAVDREALCGYLGNQYIPGDRTLVSGIFRLPPASVMTFSPDTGSCSISRYWTLREGREEGDEEALAARLRATLEEATRLRMVADVPVGAFLSGGIDSSAVTAIARREADYDFHTFTAGFGGRESEYGFAGEVSRYLGTVHHEVDIDPREVLAEFPSITWHFEEPVGDAAVVANYFLAREARKHVKVVLAGEGSDELFGGYASYRQGVRWSPWFSLPRVLRRGLDRVISLAPLSGDPFHDRVAVYGHYLGQDSLEAAQAYAWRITGITDDELRWLGNRDCTGATVPLRLPEGFRDPLNRVLALDCMNHLPDLYLMKGDKATMAHGVEERLPILDRELVGLAFRIPASLKIRGGVEKYIWRRVVRDLLPLDIADRPKQGFGVPYLSWVRGELREAVSQALDGSAFARRAFPSGNYGRLLRGFERARATRPALIAWNLFALEAWSSRFGLDLCPP
ncbi:MAG: asparagine synthase (glutamine-hydrolyzing), partial [Methanomicrobiales archaeon]|nr:asparagine synthase (glutamine-hydrolyzing) [Methanomicrobiales archaeon]